MICTHGGRSSDMSASQTPYPGTRPGPTWEGCTRSWPWSRRSVPINLTDIDRTGEMSPGLSQRVTGSRFTDLAIRHFI